MLKHKCFDLNITEYEHQSIYIIEDILEDELCDKLRYLIDNLPLINTEYTKNNNVLCSYVVLEDLLVQQHEKYYNFSTESYKYNSLLNKVSCKEPLHTTSLNGIALEEILNSIKVLNNKMNKISEAIKSINSSLEIKSTSGYILRKIKGATRLHSDGITDYYDANVTFVKDNYVGPYKMVRNASVVFALNNDYEGGTFIFKNQNVSVKLSKGSVIIFPPFWTHPHEVTELHNNTFRYTLNTWALQRVNRK